MDGQHGPDIIVASLAFSANQRPVFAFRLVLLGMALGVIGMVLFAQLTPSSNYGTGVLPGLLVIGVGMGCIFAPTFSAATLGVATWSYAPYAVFSYVSPLLTIVLAYAGFRMLRAP